MSINYEKLEKIADKASEWLGSVLSIIVHSIIFVGIFLLRLLGVSFDSILLILTTIVSLEAIYFSIFIQMTVNKHSRHLKKHNDNLKTLSESINSK